MNWVYFLYMLGYGSVWVVLVPVQLTQLIFPERRNQSWSRVRGLVIAGLAFLLGSFIAWFTWTQQARTVVFQCAEVSASAGANSDRTANDNVVGCCRLGLSGCCRGQ